MCRTLAYEARGAVEATQHATRNTQGAVSNAKPPPPYCRTRSHPPYCPCRSVCASSGRVPPQGAVECCVYSGAVECLSKPLPKHVCLCPSMCAPLLPIARLSKRESPPYCPCRSVRGRVYSGGPCRMPMSMCAPSGPCRMPMSPCRSMCVLRGLSKHVCPPYCL